MPRPWPTIVSLLFLCAGSLALSTESPELNPLWKDATEALNVPDSAKAEALFTQWIEKAEQSGIHSPEAHFNLSLASWLNKNPGKANFQLVHSALLDSSLSNILTDLSLMEQFQNQLGIKQGVATNKNFLFYFLLNRALKITLVLLALWCAVGAFLLPKPWLSARPILFTLAAVFFVIRAVGWVNEKTIGDIVVLDDSADITLYKSPEEKPEEKLLDLPSGMIAVAESGQTSGHRQLLQPIGGWVPERSIRRVSESTPNP